MKTAVVAYNLGGPDGPDAVRPFLFNLFNDPAIIRAPGPVRWLLARFLSGRRAPVAREIYARIGGRSPILEETRRQAAALEAALGDPDIRVFVAMRYWRPQAAAVAGEVAAFAPDRIVLLPLYPQFSTTTTASFEAAWRRAAAAGLGTRPAASVCCYPEDGGFVAALADLTRAGWREAAAAGRPRVLFSAHGLPKKFVAAGDPYQDQVERTVAAVVARLGIPDLDHAVCYQSRVGPLEWLGPYTDAEVRRAGAERRPLVVVPVAFVSEHSETLVELDIEYRSLAIESGAPAYVRVPAVGTHPAFIDGLAAIVRDALDRPPGSAPPTGARRCPSSFGACPCAGRA
ncbi:MAG: ferrochelatase [Rhodospirillales bacterium]